MFKIFKQVRRFSTAIPVTKEIPKVKETHQLLFEAVVSLQKANSNQIVKFLSDNHPGVFQSKRFVKKLLKSLVKDRILITEVPKDGSVNHLYRLTAVEARRKARRETKFSTSQNSAPAQ